MLQEYLQKINETEEKTYGPVANKLFKRLVDQFNQSAFEGINTSSKMKTLNLLKKLPGREPYLKEVTNSKHRSALTKLRLSAHRLEIETGRYTRPKTTVENRTCAYCKHLGHTEVEDEIHFLVRCPMYEEIRENLLPRQILQNNSNDEQKFVDIMIDGEIKSTAKFIFQAFSEREIRLDVLSTLEEVVSSAEKFLLSEKNKPNPGKQIYQVKNLTSDGMKLTLSKLRPN